MQGKKQGERKNRVKKTEDSSCSLLAHFWSTSRSPFSTFYIPFQRSGSQESNASNGVRFGVEMKELQPLQANHSKLKEAFLQSVAKSPFCCEVIPQPFCIVGCISSWRCPTYTARGKLGTSRGKLGTSRWKPTSQPCEFSLVLRNYFAALLSVCEISQTPFSPAKWFLEHPDIGRYFTLDFCCLNTKILLVSHQLHDSLVFKLVKRVNIYVIISFKLC